MRTSCFNTLSCESVPASAERESRLPPGPARTSSIFAIRAGRHGGSAGDRRRGSGGSGSLPEPRRSDRRPHRVQGLFPISHPPLSAAPRAHPPALHVRAETAAPLRRCHRAVTRLRPPAGRDPSPPRRLRPCSVFPGSRALVRRLAAGPKPIGRAPRLPGVRSRRATWRPFFEASRSFTPGCCRTWRRPWPSSSTSTS